MQNSVNESEISEMFRFNLFWSVILIFYLRMILKGVKELYLKERERQKRKKGQSLTELLFYLRYRDTIPTPLLWLYFIVIIIHPILILLGGICYFNKDVFIYIKDISFYIYLFDIGWFLIITLLSFNPKSPWADYKRWIKWRNPKKK